MADDIGFKTTPPGENVLLSDAKDLAFSSSFEMHKVQKEGLNFEQRAQIDHGLGYWPFYLMYVGDPGEKRKSVGPNTGVTPYTLKLASSSGNAYIYYMIFYEKSFI